MATAKFDIDKMNESFEKCLENEGLLLQPYTNGFRELLNFFTLLGTIFSFVAGDVADKVKILDGHCSGPNCEKYEVIAEAMQYEKDQRIDKINTAAFASASRTVLRLHRAMEFIAKLFEALATTNENHIGSLTKNIYKKTLARYHPFMVRKPAEFAMQHGVPYRQKLMTLIASQSGDETTIPSEEDIAELLKKTANTMLKCHGSLQEIYNKRKMHDLP